MTETNIYLSFFINGIVLGIPVGMLLAALALKASYAIHIKQLKDMIEYWHNQSFK